MSDRQIWLAALLVFLVFVLVFRSFIHSLLCWFFHLRFFHLADQHDGAMTAIATIFIALFTLCLLYAAVDQGTTTKEQLEMAERPFVSPSGFGFNACGKNPFVRLGNYGHKPVKVTIWSGQDIDSGQYGPMLQKQPFQKIVIPNVDQGERINFEDFPSIKFGSSCYLSGFIDYYFLKHRYCTRFCRYVTPPDAAERPCIAPLTNNLAEDEECEKYDPDPTRPK